MGTSIEEEGGMEEAGAAHTVLVVGSGGVGKTLLVEKLLSSSSDYTSPEGTYGWIEFN